MTCAAFSPLVTYGLGVSRNLDSSDAHFVTLARWIPLIHPIRTLGFSEESGDHAWEDPAIRTYQSFAVWIKSQNEKMDAKFRIF